ncbi:MAG: DUF47 family protein [Candidatus Micrarchaeia archaeon]
MVQRILRWIIPTEAIFYDMLKVQSSKMVVGAEKLHELMLNYSDDSKVDEIISQIREIEKAGDCKRREIDCELNSSLITPFDREDIYKLSQNLDDVLDLVEDVALNMKLFGIKEPSEGLVKMSFLLLTATRHVDAAVKELHNGRVGVEKQCVKLHDIESQSDDLSRKYIAELFQSNNSLKILKYKEIIESLEHAVDKCEDIGDLIEGILIKQG